MPMRFWSRADSAADAPRRLTPCLAIIAAAIVTALLAPPALGEEPARSPSRGNAPQAAETLPRPSSGFSAFAQANDRILLMINRGEFEAAEQRATEMLARAEATLGADDPAIIPGLNILAMIYQQTGRLAQAERTLLRALDLARGPDAGPGSLADVLNRMANILSDDGRLDQAEKATREAIEIGERLDGSSTLAVSLNNLGHILTAQRRFDEADAVYRRADKLTVANSALAAAMPANLAVQMMGQGRFAEAEQLLLRSIAAWEQMAEPIVIARATALLNLGRLYYETGRLDAASATFGRTLDALKGNVPDNHPLRADALQNQSQIAFDRREFAEAERLAREAVVIAGQSLPGTKFEVADWHEALAQATLLQGKLNDAVGAARQAAAILSADINRGKADKDDWELLTIVEIAASEAMVAADPEGLIANAVAARRSAFLNLQRHAATDTGAVAVAAAARAGAGGTDLTNLVREKDQVLASLREVDAAFVRTAGAMSDADARRAALGDLRSRLDALQARLSEIDARLLADFPQYLELAGGPPVPADRVIGMLADDEVLVLPVIMQNSLVTFAYGKAGGVYSWGRNPDEAAELPRIAAMLLCQAARRLNPSCARTMGASSGLVSDTARGVVAFGRSDDADEFDLEAAHRAYSLLFPGDLPELMAGKKLIIAPSPELLGFPWQLLVTRPPPAGWDRPDRDRAETYREADWLFQAHPSITVVPSVAAFDAARRSRKEADGTGPRYLGIADPVIGTTAAERDAPPLDCHAPETVALSRGTPITGVTAAAPAGAEAGILADVDALRRQPRLADSRCEVEATSKSLAGPSDLLLGGEATESRIKSLAAAGGLKAYDILHFATHGLVGGELGQTEPGLLLTPPAAASEADDGVLTAQEIAALDVGADWVILSACNTAAGSRSDAEALAGLARSFFYAGARSLLVSSWPVYSRAATRFTTTMFALLSERPPPTRGEAVALTMRRMLAESYSPETAHPAYWAPFLLVGDAGR